MALPSPGCGGGLAQQITHMVRSHQIGQKEVRLVASRADVGHGVHLLFFAFGQWAMSRTTRERKASWSPRENVVRRTRTGEHVVLIGPMDLCLCYRAC